MRRSGELERAVMDVLWESPGPVTAKEVLAALPGRDMAYTTVITVLDRLARKGAARRERTGRAWQYTPAASRESYISSLMLDALGQAGDREAVLVHFARAVSPPEAEVLRDALAGPDPEPGEQDERDEQDGSGGGDEP